MITAVVRARKEMIHRYVDAPDDVSYLREWHRHELHVEVEIELQHEDREIEFMQLKKTLQNLLDKSVKLDYVEKSCEMIAQELASHLMVKYAKRRMIISVFEDGENGGRYYHGFTNEENTI